MLVTKEFGENNTHEHANFLFYHSARDSFNLRRIFKWKAPEWKVKAATSPNNVVAYMTKEGIYCSPSLELIRTPPLDLRTPHGGDYKIEARRLGLVTR